MEKPYCRNPFWCHTKSIRPQCEILESEEGRWCISPAASDMDPTSYPFSIKSLCSRTGRYRAVSGLLFRCWWHGFGTGEIHYFCIIRWWIAILSASCHLLLITVKFSSFGGGWTCILFHQRKVLHTKTIPFGEVIKFSLRFRMIPHRVAVSRKSSLDRDHSHKIIL